MSDSGQPAFEFTVDPDGYPGIGLESERDLLPAVREVELALREIPLGHAVAVIPLDVGSENSTCGSSNQESGHGA